MGDNISILKILKKIQNQSGVMEQFISIVEHNGVWDGNLISKISRDVLVEMELVNRYNGFNFPNWQSIALIGSLNFDIRHEIDNNRTTYKQ